MSGKGYFTDRLYQELAQRGYTGDWQIGRLAQAVIAIMDNPEHFLPELGPLTATAVDPSALRLIPNDVMIHEMLARGFAVMKLPDQGRPELDTLGPIVGA